MAKRSDGGVWVVPLKCENEMKIQVPWNPPEKASMAEEPFNNHMDKIILTIAVIFSPPVNPVLA